VHGKTGTSVHYARAVKLRCTGNEWRGPCHRQPPPEQHIAEQRRDEHRRKARPDHVNNRSMTYNSSSPPRTSHVHRGDILPFRDLFLFMGQLVLKA